MATYTVNITGSLNSIYGYVTINGTKISTTGTHTYTSKPTISVYVGSDTSQLQSSCRVYLNNETVKSGYGTYNLSTDATTINIVFTALSAKGTYYRADITTSGEPESGGGSDSEHYTNTGGTAREIEGGTVLIGGVLREIESGLVLAGGVAREIEFGGGTATVTITGSGRLSGSLYMAYVIMNGTRYTGAATVEVDIGTQIDCYVGTYAQAAGTIKFNGKSVASNSSRPGNSPSYSFTCEGDTSIALSCNKSTAAGSIVITM